MAASGTVNSLTFTPPVACTLEVTCTFDAQRTVGSDWGTGASANLYCTQNGTTVSADAQPTSSSRIKYALQYAFSVAAGQSCTVGLFGQVSGASTLNFWNVELRVTMVKR